LFKVVNKKLDVVAAFFSAVGTAVEGVSLPAHFAPLVLLGKGAYLTAFTDAQLQTAAFHGHQRKHEPVVKGPSRCRTPSIRHARN
jgi:hypothetical protein